MRNVINRVSPSGEQFTPHWVAEALENLDRFKPMLSEVRAAAKILSNGYVDLEAADVIRRCAYDFYGAWMASSTEICLSVGYPITLELFTVFREFYLFSWPAEQLDFIVEIGWESELKVFRGESAGLNATAIPALSWTLNKGTAEFYRDKCPDGILLEGVVFAKDILVLFPEEQEVIATADKVRLIT